MSNPAERNDQQPTKTSHSAHGKGISPPAARALNSLAKLDELMAAFDGQGTRSEGAHSLVDVPTGRPAARAVKVLDLPAKKASGKNRVVGLGTLPAKSLQSLPPIDSTECMRLYVSGKHRALTQIFHDHVQYYFENPVVELTREAEIRLNQFVETFLYFITKPDYLITEEQVPFFVGFHPLIANLVAISSFGTTEPQIAALVDQPSNFAKLLILLSIRNKTWLDPRVFFDAQPELASQWYTVYTLSVAGWSNEQVYLNGRRHVLAVDERLEGRNENVAHPYFACTYIDPQRDRHLKSYYNRSVARQMAHVKINNCPQRDSLAVISGKWFPGSAVHRSLYPLVATLKQKYRMTLVHLGPENPLTDLSLFDEVKRVQMQAGKFDITSLCENDWQFAFFPDVGMTGESIWLANLRLAPIQMTATGHPHSTSGTQVDYFLSGTHTELPEKAAEYYSERLVLLPGLGAHPVVPNYQLRRPEKATDVIHINCPWGFTKINYPWLMLLRQIQERANKPIHFQFLPGSGATVFSAIIPLLRDLGAIFGKNCTLYSARPYSEYMETQERGHMALESHPFGGYNTVVDAVYLGVPMITREGTRFYNRAGSATLRKIGLGELVATTDEEYVEKAVRLINDDEYRQEITRLLQSADLQREIFDTRDCDAMLRAVDYLIDNDAALRRQPQHEPIVIR